jgi:hypothetical protein
VYGFPGWPQRDALGIQRKGYAPIIRELPPFGRSVERFIAGVIASWRSAKVSRAWFRRR